MDIITRFLSTGLLIWLGALMAVILIRMLRGDIESSGFLQAGNGTDIAPERVVQMSLIYVVIGKWAFDALHTPLDPGNPSLPELPNQLLELFTGSNVLYLAGKITRSTSGASS